jgi:hypothetical protein
MQIGVPAHDVPQKVGQKHHRLAAPLEDEGQVGSIFRWVDSCMQNHLQVHPVESLSLSHTN